MRYGDNPISRAADDLLSRTSSVQALSKILCDPGLETPISIGIYGPWGSGKTSVMRMLQSSLPEGAIAFWFDAWQYGHQADALWRALLLAFVENLRKTSDSFELEVRTRLEQELDRLVVSLYRSQSYSREGELRVNWKAAAPLAFQAALGFVPGARETIAALKTWLSKDGSVEEVASIIERERITTFREQVSSMEQFRSSLCTLVTTFVTNNSRPDLRRLYVFIDDLDRCLPEAAVGALEALKLFLDIPGCVFVLGMDRAVVEQGIRVRYRELTNDPAGGLPVDSRQYLDKIIQVPFTLPALDQTQIEDFVQKWCRQNDQNRIGKFCASIVARGVSANPRSLKRTLNVLRLVLDLGRQPDDAGMEYLAKIVVLQTSYESFYRQVVEEPRLLLDFESTDYRHENPRLRSMLASGRRFASLDDEARAALVYTTRVSAG